MDAGLRRAIREAARALHHDAVTLTQRLVRHRSVLGEEASCLAEMEAVYAELGLVPRRVEIAGIEQHPGFSPPLIP
ncbi:MAG: peptidase M20, partial [Acidobacteriota bacterium]|nr:peptidase M20 [Acidobacteriota bacterium]